MAQQTRSFEQLKADVTYELTEYPQHDSASQQHRSNPDEISVVYDANVLDEEHPFLRTPSEKSRSLTDGYVPRFANRTFLGRYFPGTDPDNAKGEKTSLTRAKREVMLRYQLMLALLILNANISFTVWALTTSPPVKGIGTLLVNDCTFVSRVDSGVHAVVNVLSSVLLSAGNYCMQVLVAPCSDEIQAAHAKDRYFDVGCHSVRGLRDIKRRRVLVWGALGFTATLLHLFWNSTIFSSTPFSIVPVAYVTKDFLNVTDNWMQTNPSIANQSVDPFGPSINSLHSAAQSYTRLNNTQCIEAYINPLNTTGEILVVVNQTAAQNNQSSLVWGFVSGTVPGEWDNSRGWICGAYPDAAHGRYCEMGWARTFADDWHVTNASFEKPWTGGPRLNVSVEYCLAAESANQNDRCGLHYSAHLLILLCVFLASESALIAWIALKCRDRTLVVVGDVIADGLKCQNIDYAHSAGQRKIVRMGPQEWATANAPKWFSAVSWKMWAVSLTLFTLAIGVTLGLFATTLSALKGNGLLVDLVSLWNEGFGRVNGYSLMGGVIGSGDQSASSLLGHVLFANFWQVLISFLYLFYNNILTRQCVAHEVTRYIYKKRSLRVSTPENVSQRSTYFLSLPFRYAVPLVTTFMLLHTAVSQSIFIVQTTAYGPGVDGQHLPSSDASRLGFSAIAMFISLMLGILLVAALIVNSFREYFAVPNKFPQMATNSSAIVAMCQQAPEDKDAYLYPIQLGVIQYGVSVAQGCQGRVAFSSDCLIEEPERGVRYEQPIWPPAR